MRSPWDESLHLDETIQSKYLFINLRVFFSTFDRLYFCAFQNETTMGVYHLDELYLSIGYSIHGHYLTIHTIEDLRPRGGSIQEVNIATNEIVKHFGVDRDMFLAAIEPLLSAMFQRPLSGEVTLYLLVRINASGNSLKQDDRSVNRN